MPRRRRVSKLRHVGEDCMFELAVGRCVPGDPSVFEDPVVARRAWLRYRRELLAEAAPGRRPYAWWVFDAAPDAPPPWPDRGGDMAAAELECLRFLAERGHLSVDEADEALERELKYLGGDDVPEPNRGRAQRKVVVLRRALDLLGEGA